MEKESQNREHWGTSVVSKTRREWPVTRDNSLYVTVTIKRFCWRVACLVYRHISAPRLWRLLVLLQSYRIRAWTVHTSIAAELNILLSLVLQLDLSPCMNIMPPSLPSDLFIATTMSSPFQYSSVRMYPNISFVTYVYYISFEWQNRAVFEMSLMPVSFLSLVG